jgi:hypothetical protein
MAEKQINIVIGADIAKLEKGFKDAVTVVGASGKKISSEMEAVTKSIEKDFARIANSPSTKRTVTQLQNLALKVQALGPEYEDMSNKIIQAAGRIQDKVGDAGAQIKYFASDTRRIDAVIMGAQGIAGAFGIAQGAAALFGSKNKDLEKTMLKVQGALALMQGIQTVQNALLKENALMTGLAAAKQTVLAVATYATASATNALKFALVSTGIGAIVVLLGTLIAGYADTSEATDELVKKQKEAADELKKLGVDYIKGLNDNAQEEFDLIEKRGKLNNLSQVQIIQEQKKFAYEQQKINAQKIGDMNVSMEESKAAFELSNSWTKKYNALDIDLQLAQMDEKKKNDETYWDQYIVNFKKFNDKVVKASADKNAKLATKANNLPSADIAPKQFMEFAPEINPIIAAEDKAYKARLFGLSAFLKTKEGLELIEQRKREQKQIAHETKIRETMIKFNEDNLKFTMAINAQLVSIQSDAYANIGLAIADGLMNGGNVLESVFSIILNSVASFADAYGKALIAAAVASEAFTKLLIANPVLAIGAGIALVAAGAVVRSVAQKGPTAFAEGGIVSGPTLGLMGEYPGASTNPEVIAPLSKLQGMLVPSTGGFPAFMETRFDGRDLYLAVKKYERDSQRG